MGKESYMKILKKVSLPTAPKSKRKGWEKILKRHLEKALKKYYRTP